MRKSHEQKLEKSFDWLSLAWVVMAFIYSFTGDKYQAWFCTGYVLFCNLKAHLYRIEHNQNKNT
jgi:hypothetical protein